MSDTDMLDKLLDALDNNPNYGNKLLLKIHGISETNLIIILEEIKKLREDSNKRFTASDHKFDSLIKTMSEGFKQVNRRLDKHEMWLRKIGGDNLELLSLTWFKAVIEAKGFPSENLIRDVHFVDEKKISGMKDIQIDIYQEDPMIVVEVSTFIDDLHKVELFCNKLEFFNATYIPKPRSVLVTYGFSEEIEDKAIKLLSKYDVVLITIGRKANFDKF